MNTKIKITKAVFALVLPITVILFTKCTSNTKYSSKNCCYNFSTQRPSFNGCWLTQFNQYSYPSPTTKVEIKQKELYLNIQEVGSNKYVGNWIGLLSGTPGRFTGNISDKTVKGVTFLGAYTTPIDSVSFTRSESGLTFEGKFGSITKPWEFYWNGVKISDCPCSEKVMSPKKKY